MGYLAYSAFLFKSVKSFPTDERIQILLESFEMIRNLQDTCWNLARYQCKKTINISQKKFQKIFLRHNCANKKFQVYYRKTAVFRFALERREKTLILIKETTFIFYKVTLFTKVFKKYCNEIIFWRTVCLISLFYLKHFGFPGKQTAVREDLLTANFLQMSNFCTKLSFTCYNDYF